MSGYFSLVVLLGITSIICSSVPREEVEALYDIYNNLDGENWIWKNETTWGPVWNFTVPFDESDPCGGSAGEWQGIMCYSSLTMPCNQGNVSHCHIASLELVEQGLVGTFPDAVCNLSYIEFIDLSSNNISGHIPSCIKNLEMLVAFVLKSNSIAGTIPPTMYSLTTLQIIDLSINRIVGSLLPEIGQLHNLYILDLGLNSLTGSIPPEVFDLTELRDLSLFGNFITGSFPSSVGKLTNVYMLDVDINFMTGTIPAEVGTLVSLHYMPWGRNHFTGTIPPEIGNLVELYYIGLGNSRLTGTISPEIFKSNMSKLQDVNFLNNGLSGPIPSTVADMNALQYIQFYDNQFSGTIPSEIGKMTQLVVLQLQNNRLSGKLSNILWQAANMSLINVDFSGNNLSGDIPGELFSLPYIETISLSTNCFSGTLPDNICEASRVSVLSMNSLSASSGCKTTYSLPGSKVLLNSAVGGTIPTCIFALPLATCIHMSGNGFYGSIGDISPVSSLIDFSLAYNQLTGTIPVSIQQFPMARLDLSYNRLTGDCSHFNTSYSRYANCPVNSSDCKISRKLNLEVNRLSGKVPDHIGKNNRKIDILNGNLFSCHYLPSKDPSFGQYTCGSSALNYSCYVVIGVIISYACAMGAFHLYFHPNLDITGEYNNKGDSVFRILQKWLQDTASIIELYCHILNETRRKRLPNTLHFHDLLVQVARGSAVIITLGFVCCIPVYALQLAEYGSDNGKYTTHKHSYWWVVSAMNTSGMVPAIIFLLTWLCCMCVILIDYINRNQRDINSYKSRAISSVDSERESFRESSVKIKLWKKGSTSIGINEEEDYVYVVFDWITYALILAVVNSVVVIGANGLYMYCVRLHFSVIQQRLVEISFALFVNIWNFGMVPGFVFKRGMDIKHRVMVKTYISLFNSVAVPCMVTALTDPTCFRGLYVLPEKITSRYIYKQCMFFVQGNQCLVYLPLAIESTAAYPPFHYNYGCISELQRQYIPVYLFTYAFILMMLPVVYLLLPMCVKYDSLPDVLRSRLPSILWATRISPDSLSKSPSNNTPSSETNVTFDENKSDMKTGSRHRDFMKADSIISQFTHHLTIALTFGICSPPLACAILAVIVATSFFWRGIVGKYVALNTPGLKLRSDSEFEVTSDMMVEYKANVQKLEECLHTCESSLDLVMYPLLWGSSVFFAFLCWDNAGDQVGWRDSLWLPLTVMSLPILVSIVDPLYQRLRVSREFYDGEENQRKEKERTISLKFRGSHMEMEDDIVTTNRESFVNPMAAVHSGDEIFIS